MNPPCPRCDEERLTEVVKSAGRREAFCNVCSHHWPYDVEICHCGCVPIAHIHEEADNPTCPRCGKRPLITQPLRVST